ncbi:hypothetical protein ACLOJK_020098 [Asimina triloba]
MVCARSVGADYLQGQRGREIAKVSRGCSSQRGPEDTREGVGRRRGGGHRRTTYAQQIEESRKQKQESQGTNRNA